MENLKICVDLRSSVVSQPGWMEMRNDCVSLKRVITVKYYLIKKDLPVRQVFGSSALP